MPTTQRKAKRKLSEIDFTNQGAHLALVSESQGGPANGADYALIMKSVKFSKEMIEKMQQVRVTMELPDFLQKFFYIYGEDAKVLAYMMGYKEPADTQAMEDAEAKDEYQKWIEERASSFEILKSLNDSESLVEALSELTEDEYLEVIKSQSTLEKFLIDIEKNSVQAEQGDKAKVKETKVNKKASPSKQKGKLNMEETEVVEKSQLDAVQKAFDEQKEKLEKALAALEALEAERKEAVEKQRKQKVVDVVKDEAKAEVLFKSLSKLEEADFEAVVSTLAEMQSVVEKSSLFEEKGVQVEDKVVATEESPVAKVIKARLKNQSK